MKPLILNLDIQEDSYESCDLMQGYDYNMQFNITDNYTDLDLTGVLIQIQMQKADHKFIIQTEKITVANNVINVAIDKDLTRVSGKGKLQVVLSKSNRTFGSWVVKCKIKESAINNNDGQSENKVTITETLTNKITEAIKVKEDTEKLIEEGGVATKKQLWDYESMPQDSLPGKLSSIQTTSKIVKKIDDNEFIAIQKTNKGYLKYKLNNKIGVNSDGSNYGGSHELIRLVEVAPLATTYVYSDISNPVLGELIVYAEQSNDKNILEKTYFDLSKAKIENNEASKSSGNGFGIYQLKYNNSVEYNVPATLNSKANIAFLAASSSVDNVEIYINDVLTKSFNPKTFFTGQITGATIDFNVPTFSSDKTYRLKIKANGEAGYFFISAFNLYELKEYNGQFIDNWKAYGTDLPSFLATGANEYAMADETNKWFGSYHGGEVLDLFQIWWNNQVYYKNESRCKYRALEYILNGSWCTLIDKFDIYQKTTLIDKATMTSKFDLSQDGTFNIKCGLNNKSSSPILFNALFTALTSTNTSFNYVYIPEFLMLNKIPSEKQIHLNLTEGFISQVDSTNALQLDIRFSKFNYSNNARGCYILDSKYYRKFYYGVVTDTKNVNIPALQFSKSLDFNIR